MATVWENKALSCFVKEKALSDYYTELDLMYQPLQTHLNLSNELICFTKELLYKLATTESVPGGTSTLEVQSQVHEIVSELNQKTQALGNEYRRKLLDAVKQIYQTDSAAVPAPINFESVLNSAIQPYLEKASSRRERIYESAWKNHMLTKTFEHPVMQTLLSKNIFVETIDAGSTASETEHQYRTKAKSSETIIGKVTIKPEVPEPKIEFTKELEGTVATVEEHTYLPKEAGDDSNPTAGIDEHILNPRKDSNLKDPEAKSISNHSHLKRQQAVPLQFEPSGIHVPRNVDFSKDSAQIRSQLDSKSDPNKFYVDEKKNDKGDKQDQTKGQDKQNKEEQKYYIDLAKPIRLVENKSINCFVERYNSIHPDATGRHIEAVITCEELRYISAKKHKERTFWILDASPSDQMRKTPSEPFDVRSKISDLKVLGIHCFYCKVEEPADPKEPDFEVIMYMFADQPPRFCVPELQSTVFDLKTVPNLPKVWSRYADGTRELTSVPAQSVGNTIFYIGHNKENPKSNESNCLVRLEIKIIKKPEGGHLFQCVPGTSLERGIADFKVYRDFTITVSDKQPYAGCEIATISARGDLRIGYLAKERNKENKTVLKTQFCSENPPKRPKSSQTFETEDDFFQEFTQIGILEAANKTFQLITSHCNLTGLIELRLVGFDPNRVPLSHHKITIASQNETAKAFKILTTETPCCRTAIAVVAVDNGCLHFVKVLDLWTDKPRLEYFDMYKLRTKQPVENTSFALTIRKFNTEVLIPPQEQHPTSNSSQSYSSTGSKQTTTEVWLLASVHEAIVPFKLVCKCPKQHKKDRETKSAK